MYLPFPESIAVSKTVTAYGPKTECDAAGSVTVTATFSHPKSTVFHMEDSDSTVYEVYRPTEGLWREIKASGSIKMTPMSVVNERITNSLAQVHIPYLSYKIARAGRTAAKVNGKCQPIVRVVSWDCKAAIVKGSYVEQGDLSYFKSKYPDAPHYVLPKGELDDNKIEKAKSEAFAELFQAYNLGEEIAELRETIAGVQKLALEAVNLILRSRSLIASLLKKDKLTEASSRWMEFRYGIMPIIYSVQDLLSLKTEGKYRTTRKTVRPEAEFPANPSESLYFQDIGVSDVRCTITAKARWATEELKNFDMININPLTTFTAVLPWSMVIRWFFNVQSYLDCRVKSLTSLALQTSACAAIRVKKEYGTYLSVRHGYQNIHIVDDGSFPGYPGYFGVTDFGTFTDFRTQNVLLRQYSINNYQRYLFQPSDVKLVFSPYLSWQRHVDGMILMMGTMSKLLRRLK